MQIENTDFQSGTVLLFNKPLNWTSFDVVNKVRWLLKRHLGVKKLKVGHAGTLDPRATGLLVVCTGQATKRLESLQADDKAYTATVKLGARTASYDAEQPEEDHRDTGHLTQAVLEAALEDFRGEIQQVPPVFSAVQVGGKRAYVAARAGEAVELRPRTVTIHELQLTRFGSPSDFDLHVVCSKGTYIRSLAHDLGQALGVGGYLTALHRTRSGNFTVQNAWTLGDFEAALAGLRRPEK